MSYWTATDTGANHYSGGVLQHASTPLLYDVAALQKLYGANMSTRTGDTVYGFNNNSGRDAFDLQRDPSAVFTIWDAGGIDTLDLSGYSSASRVDLREGAFSDAGGMTSNISIAFGAVIENAVGGAGNDNITGNQVANHLAGNGGNDQLDGGLGNDLLDGGAGADILKGGAGNDAYVVDDAGDVVGEAAAEGIDKVASAVGYTLGANVENLTLTGSASINGTGNALNNVINGNASANILNGAGGADTMNGGAGNDIYVVDNAGDKAVESSATGGIDLVQSAINFRLGIHVEKLTLTGSAVSGTGNGLANVLNGNASANILNGAGGADTMNGGAGNDTYVVDNVGDKVVESSATGGTDLVRSAINFRLGINVENLTLTGSAVSGTGNGLANVLTGNASANILNGGGGADTMTGGGGKDIYVVDNIGDKVIEAAGGGTDTVQSSIAFTLGAEVENLTLTGNASIKGTGNALANVITDNAASNAIRGGAGNDTLSGGGGADRFVFDTALNGTANVDKILDFSAADDTIYLDDAHFAGLAYGTLAASAFVLGNTAKDANDRILYDQASGRIFFDADGSGAAAAILFAQVKAGTILTAADFSGY